MAIRNIVLMLAHASCVTSRDHGESYLWRRQMVTGAASLTMTLTVPGLITKRDHIVRTEPLKPYLASKAIWCTVRLADPLIAASLVRRHRHRKHERPSTRSRVLIAMAGVSGVRHSLWALHTLKKPWPLWISLPVSVGNTFINWLHVRAALEREDECPDGDTEPLGAVAALGILCFVVGSYLETASELQRLAFKANPANAGQLCTVGLWRGAAHINYFGYALWRTGIGLVSAPPWSVAYGIAHLVDFRLRGVPLLRRHMRARYGSAWDEYAAQTAVLVPGVL